MSCRLSEAQYSKGEQEVPREAIPTSGKLFAATGAKHPLQGEYRHPYPESCKAISDSSDLEAQNASPMWESTTKSYKTKGPVAAKATETCVGPSSHPGRELYHPGCNPWGSARADPCTDKKQKATHRWCGGHGRAVFFPLKPQRAKKNDKWCY